MTARSEPTRRADRRRTSTARVAVALVAAEIRRTCRHPLSLAAVVGLLLWWGSGLLRHTPATRFPVLSQVDYTTQLSLVLLLGSAALLTSDLATIRARRFGADTAMDVMPVTGAMRLVAGVGSAAFLGLVGVVAVLGYLAILASAPGAVGSLDPAEVMTGPAVVFLLGCVGTLLGAVAPAAAVAPVAVAGFLAITVVASFPIGLGASAQRWLLPLAFEDVTALPMPRDLLDRPAGEHLVYLLLLAATAVSAAVLRRSHRRNRVATAAVTVICLVATVSAGVANVPDGSARLDEARRVATETPARQQVCRVSGLVTYCAFAEFTPWIDQWRRVTEAVLAAAGGGDQPWYVRQRVFAAGRRPGGEGTVPPPPVELWRSDDRAAGTPGSIPVGTAWGDGTAELELATSVAGRLVTALDPAAGSQSICGGPAVVVLWLAGHADADAARAMRERAGNGSGGLVLSIAGFDAGFAFKRWDLAIALDLLSRQDSAANVAANWAELVRPATTSTQAAKLTGSTVPAQRLEDGDASCVNSFG